MTDGCRFGAGLGERAGIMTGRSWPRFPKRPDDFGFGERVTVTELLKKSG